MKKTKNQKILGLDYKNQLDFCHHITQDIRTTIDPDFLRNLNTDRLKRYFFVNQGWRLTNNGFSIVSTHYHSFTSENPANKVLTGSILLNMDNCIQGPWYVRGNKITVFNQSTHFELQMTSGNINAFLDFRNPTTI